MYKLGVIGDKNSIQGFLALGLDIFPSYSAEDVKDNLKKCADSGYGIIYITEQALALIGDEAEKFSGMQIPAVIPIPGLGGTLGIGMGNVKKCVERAVGSDIIS